jgi:hypothetical protein
MRLCVRYGLVAVNAFVAIGAWAGAAVLALGGMDSVADQLPWRSHALGAVALALCVAVPMTVAAVAVLHRGPKGPRLSLLAALILVGWLVGQTFFVGLSPLQLVYLVLAALIAWLAVRLRRQSHVS